MRINKTEIADVLLIDPEIFADARGSFHESWNDAAFRAHGLDLKFVQDNHSRSRPGVVRGLHFQNPKPQGKLIRVVLGRIWDVAVDLRRSSRTYGHWVSTELSADNRRMKWIPPGFAHGFLSVEASDVIYKCTAPYDPDAERSLRWDDPTLAIPWPIEGAPLLSVHDRNASCLADIEPFP